MCSILRSDASVRAGRPGRSKPFPGLREGTGCTAVHSCWSSFLLFFSSFGFNVFAPVRNDLCSVIPKARETVPSHLVPGWFSHRCCAFGTSELIRCLSSVGQCYSFKGSTLSPATATSLMFVL